ncbi:MULTISPECIES: hypothetical protein [unclassified Lentimonas]|nr:MULTISPECIES: hypothetical protein [unclassified Lentimonas]
MNIGIIAGILIMILGALVTDASGVVPVILVLAGATISGVSWLQTRS